MKLFFVSATITRNSVQEKVVLCQSFEPMDSSHVFSRLNWETAPMLADVGGAFPYSPVLLTAGQVEVIQAFKAGQKPWNKVHGAACEEWFETLNWHNVSDLKVEAVNLFEQSQNTKTVVDITK